MRTRDSKRVLWGASTILPLAALAAYMSLGAGPARATITAEDCQWPPYGGYSCGAWIAEPCAPSNWKVYCCIGGSGFAWTDCEPKRPTGCCNG